MLNNQFRKYYVDLKNKGLSLSEKAYMTAIYDRMESSTQRKTFYDEQEQDYYVIYTIDEMASELEIGATTVKRVMKSLVNKGWIWLKKTRGNVNCIFICDDYKVSKSSTQASQQTNSDSLESPKWSSNYKNKQTKNKLDTYKSQDVQLAEHQTISENSIATQTVALNGLEYTLQHKLCLPSMAINALFDVSSSNVDTIKSNLATILKAKRIAVKKANKELYFENSTEIQCTLADRIRYIFMQAQNKAKKPKQYILQAFVNYFYEIICPKAVVKPRTCIHKSGYQEKLPEWAKSESSVTMQQTNQSSNAKTTHAEIRLLMAKINAKQKA